MQVTETLAEGLRREYQVVVPLAELDARATERLSALKDRVRLDGFRPGKVPIPHLKRVYGRAVMSEVIEQAINEANRKIVDDGGFRLATEPRIKLAAEEEEAVRRVIEGRADLAYTVALEILPKIELADFSKIKVERPVAEVTDDEVNQAIDRIAAANRPFVEKQGAAEQGDRVVMSFRGTIGGEAFEGGTADEVPVIIGQGQFIPGFEEQVVGLSPGETRTITVTFPKNYLAEHLAGKEAQFEVTVKSVSAPGEITIDDGFAKSLGLESLDKLKAQVRERIAREYAAASRTKVKRALLDAIDERHQFSAPPSLIEQEFAGIWESVTSEMKRQGTSFADEGQTEEQAREEYRKIADRRVRLGLVLAEIGEKNSISVSDEEITRGLIERARMYPGREQQAFEQMRSNPSIVAAIRAPIFEEKVIDFLLELAQVTDKKVDRAALYADDDDEHGHGHDHGQDHDHHHHDHGHEHDHDHDDAQEREHGKADAASTKRKRGKKAGG